MPSKSIKMATYSLDAETFINEIKKHRELWDLCNDGVRYKSNMKQNAWGKVARIFIQEFDTMKDLEKLEVFRKLHSKWRNIRDAYVRHLKRKDGKRPYMYARNLTFLNQRYLNNVNQSNSDDESSEDDKTLEAGKPRIIEVNTTCQSDEDTSPIVNLKRRKVEKRDKGNIEFVDTPTAIQAVDFNQCVTEDEDRSFFDSLLPAVREFDLDQKLEFRCEVLKLIKHIRSTVSFKTEPQNIEYDL